MPRQVQFARYSPASLVSETIMDPITYFRDSDQFADELSIYLKGKRVLEVFAGNGYLAKRLSDRGVNVRATSIFSGHDGHFYGMHFPVEELTAMEAISEYGDDSDVLLMSWPVADERAYHALKLWGVSKPIVYIGEVTNPDLPGLMGLSGCASDRFFDSITWEREFSSYSGNMLEKAGVIYGKV